MLDSDMGERWSSILDHRGLETFDILDGYCHLTDCVRRSSKMSLLTSDLSKQGSDSSFEPSPYSTHVRRAMRQVRGSILFKCLRVSTVG